MRKERRARILRRLVLGLAVAAVVAPAAQARVDEFGTGAQSGSVAQQTLPSSDTLVIHGDDKVLAPSGDGASTAVIHGDDKVIVPTPATPVTAVRSPSTFNWGDALIGAGGALALMLLAGGAALGTRRRARPTAA